MTYDSKGATQYFEYGRYKPQDPKVVGAGLPESDGNVRRVKVPNLKLEEDGKPTQASLQALSLALSASAGHGTKTEMTCTSADEKKVVAYAMRIANDPNRSKYSWTPWSANQCRTFSNKAVDAGR